jgi:hypothetical protein
MENKDNKPSPKSHKAEEADKDKLHQTIRHLSEAAHEKRTKTIDNFVTV